MTTDRGQDYLISQIEELRQLPRETDWLEFKVNNADPDEIGEYLSALSNAAALAGRPSAYLVWGIEDLTHDVVGTRFEPGAAKRGNEPLETWLLRLLDPKIHFQFHRLEVRGHPVVLLEVARAFRHPVRFKKESYIRIGPVKKPVKEAPDLERALWRALDQTPFENLVAMERLDTTQLLELIDYEAYFRLLDRPVPSNQTGTAQALVADGLATPCPAGGWNITNLGSVLFAKRLADFPALRRKAVRVVQYKGTDRIHTIKEQAGVRGLANGFERLVEYVNDLLPSNEVIGQALRQTLPMFPVLAIRELVANALIHQDFLITGAGVTIEIFDDRIEITNPGEPLVEVDRFLDSPPRSRNETLASLMRRFGICEERGSGIDKVVSLIEHFQLPAPLFEVPPSSTRTVLFAHRPLREMDKADRVRACYLHACLRYVMRDYLTNSSLRERFGIEERNKATVSRYIREAVEEGAIKPFDEGASRRFMKYVPRWA